MTISQRITALPPAPDPAIHPRTEFAQVAAASVIAQRALPGELNTFADQANALAADVTTKSASAVNAAAVATTQAQAAQAVGGVLAFSASKNYAVGEAAYSLINGQTYRRVSAGVNATDPSNSPLWRLLSGNDINGTFVVVSVAGTVIDLSLGSYFKTSKSANTTFTFANMPAGGCSFMLELETLAADLVIAFPTSVRSQSNIAPSFQANKSHRLSFISSNGGARFTMSPATNYDI